MNIEFGSDFHTLSREYCTGCTSLMQIHRGATLLADGRMGLIRIILTEGWKRLWVPEYFCYEVFRAVERHTSVKLMPYKDAPDSFDAIERLPFCPGDAILRMNYFGLRSHDIREKLDVPVVEDHSHDLLSSWALSSNADWCFASLRKSLPIAEGGVVWSPKCRKLVGVTDLTAQNEKLALKRWLAMDMKADYLLHKGKNKDVFRSLYVDTEKELDNLEISDIDIRSREVVESLDIIKWYHAKRRNWQILAERIEGVMYLRPEDEFCTPFSLVLVFDSLYRRELVREALIGESIYPSVLWEVPKSCCDAIWQLSCRLLSIHCDGRYSEQEMVVLSSKINKILKKI